MKVLMSLYLLPVLGILAGIVGFVSNRKHLLNRLLSLEFLVLNLFWLIILIRGVLGSDIYVGLYFLGLAACEGALGLALLVSVVRGYGSDIFISFRVLQC